MSVKLCDDVILYILLFYRENIDCNSRKERLTTAAISQRWRQVALDYKAYWTTLTIGKDQKPLGAEIEVAQHWFNTFAANKEPLALDCDIQQVSFTDGSLPRLHSLLARFQDRWRKLTFQGV
jgi:hypothetical protein